MIHPTTYRKDITKLIGIPHFAAGYMQTSNGNLRINSCWSSTVHYHKSPATEYDVYFLVSVVYSDEWIKGVLLIIEDEFGYENQKPDAIGYACELRAIAPKSGMSKRE